MQWRSCSLVFLFAGISTVLSTAASALITIGALGTPEAFDFDAYNFEMLGGLAYAVGSTDTPGPLRVIDVSNPEAPIQLGVLDLAADGGAVGVAVADELAYVATRLGLRIVDVSNPTVPVKIGGYDTPGDPVDVEVVGPLAYIADGSHLLIIDFGPEYRATINIDLDIKSGSDQNSLNLKSQGVVPVAILGSDTFDVMDVDVTALAFGPNGAVPTHKDVGHAEDVNDDGFTDLVSHYWTRETGIAPANPVACVTGVLLDGSPFEGCHEVLTIGR